MKYFCFRIYKVPIPHIRFQSVEYILIRFVDDVCVKTLYFLSTNLYLHYIVHSFRLKINKTDM